MTTARTSLLVGHHEVAAKRGHQGIVERHARGCASRDGGRCNCEPSYEAWISVKEGTGYRKLRRTFSRFSGPLLRTMQERPPGPGRWHAVLRP